MSTNQVKIKAETVEKVDSALAHIITSVFSLETLTHAIAGTIGGSVTMTAFYPLDLVRSNMQAVPEFKGKSAIEVTQLLMSKSQSSNDFKGKSIPEMLRTIFISGRILALYKGLGPVLIALACSNFTYFYVNNLLKLFVKLRSKRSVTIWENILLNIIAGCVNVLVTNPIHVVSTRLKLQHKRLNHEKLISTSKDLKEKKTVTYHGVVDTFTKIINQEGVKALWNGTIASLILVLNPTIQFVLYDKLKAAWLSNKKALSSFDAFVIAAIAKLLASCITYPVQTVQAKIRNDKTGHYKNTIQCFTEILKNDGVSGLFQGLDVNVIQKVLMAAFHFTIYEKILSIIFTLFRIKASAHAS